VLSINEKCKQNICILVDLSLSNFFLGSWVY
jgi:hypothetical protein